MLCSTGRVSIFVTFESRTLFVLFGHVVLYLFPNFTWVKGEIQCNFLGAEGRLQSTRIMAAQDKMSAHGTIELILGILPCPLCSPKYGVSFISGGILLPQFQCSKEP